MGNVRIVGRWGVEVYVKEGKVIILGYFRKLDIKVGSWSLIFYGYWKVM